MWLLMLAYFVSHIFFKDWRHHKQDAVADWYMYSTAVNSIKTTAYIYTLQWQKKRPGLDFSMNTPTNLPRVELSPIYNALSMDEWAKYLRRKQKNWFQYSVGFYPFISTHTINRYLTWSSYFFETTSIHSSDQGPLDKWTEHFTQSHFFETK